MNLDVKEKASLVVVAVLTLALITGILAAVRLYPRPTYVRENCRVVEIEGENCIVCSRKFDLAVTCSLTR